MNYKPSALSFCKKLTILKVFSFLDLERVCFGL